MALQFLNSLFSFDPLTQIMGPFIFFIGLVIFNFSSRYMQGAVNYKRFLKKLALLILLLLFTVSLDNLILFFIAWLSANRTLVDLMVQNPKWEAAKESGKIALKNYYLAAFFISLAFLSFYLSTGHLGIKSIINQHPHSIFNTVGLSLLLLGAMAQSAIWPFHRWLLSSLNSPTPTSAIMHAGLINGGGFLLVRFAPLYMQKPQILAFISIAALITALLGTFWKLIQPDIKRMLVCSTLGQMGFMLLQFSLGLVSATVAHLIFHGFFKAYLFLISSSCAEEKSFNLENRTPSGLTIFSALSCGLLASLIFGYVTGKSWLSKDTTVILMLTTFIAGSQLCLAIANYSRLKNLLLSLLIVSFSALAYGLVVALISHILKPLQLDKPQPLTILHTIIAVALTLPWVGMLLLRNRNFNNSSWWIKTYVLALNASRPDPSTITAHRNQYHY